MAGFSVRKKLRADLKARGGSDFVLEYIGDGGTVSALAEEMGVSRSFMSRILNGDYRAEMEEGRKILADKMADDSLELIDGLATKEDLSSQDVQLAKERVAVRKWMSALNHPDRFAPKQQNVTVNIGELHLGALKKIKTEMLDVTPTEQPDPLAIEADDDE